MYLILCALAFFACLLVTKRAGAWVELRVAQDDIEVRVEPDGSAIVEHRVLLLVSGGPLREVIIRGVDADATPEPDGYLVTEKEDKRSDRSNTVPIEVIRLDPSDKNPLPALRVKLNGDEGLRRGAYVLHARYRTDALRAAAGDAAEGAPSGLRDLAWTGPAWEDGLDATKVTFTLPTAPTPPQVKESEDDMLGTVLSSLRRRGARDELELVRAYAPKGERVTWRVVADARAFAAPADAAVFDRPGEPGRIKTMADDIASRRTVPATARLLMIAFAVVVTLLGVLGMLKGREHAALLAEHGAKPRPLVPLGLGLRTFLMALLFGAGLVLQMLAGKILLGSFAVLAAAACAAHLRPLPRSSLRGQGEWLSLTTKEALRPAPPPRVRFDVSTRSGKLALLGIAAVLLAVSLALWQRLPSVCVLAWLDTLPFVALFVTGRLDQLPPDLAARPVPFYRGVAAALERDEGTRIVPRARLATASKDIDELRLHVAVSGAPPGFRALEIGVSYAPAFGTYVEMPEIIVRCDEGAALERRLESAGGFVRLLRGRRANERAFVFAPRFPDVAATVKLLRALSTLIRAAR